MVKLSQTLQLISNQEQWYSKEAMKLDNPNFPQDSEIEKNTCCLRNFLCGEI
jgi:hypothetical protein